jgi:hypothetical protein
MMICIWWRTSYAICSYTIIIMILIKWDYNIR